jgi:hypothetical protein
MMRITIVSLSHGSIKQVPIYCIVDAIILTPKPLTSCFADRLPYACESARTPL